MEILSEKKYYQKLAKLQEDFIKESPCDPDITDGQLKAYLTLENFKKNNTYKTLLTRI